MRDSSQLVREDDSALFTLVDTIEALSSARTVEDVAAVVRSQARRISGADGVTFVLRDGDQCWYLDEDAVGPLWKGRRFPMTACISGWAMLNAETAVIPDIYADPRIPHDAYRPTFVRSLVMTPVRAADPIAAIGAYWAEQRHPHPDEVTRLHLMARATATALENVQLLATLEENIQRRDFLIRELDHRAKNALATVQSIASQTLRGAASPEAFQEALARRLMAMSRAHDYLADRGWAPADLEGLVLHALSPHMVGDAVRLSVEGPRVKVSPDSALVFMLTMNELAANARAFGALSGREGKVTVSWRLDDAAERTGLVFEWTEAGGPAVSAPGGRGFGLKMIEGGLPRDLSGQAQASFEPEGFRWRLVAPLSDRLVAG